MNIPLLLLLVGGALATACTTHTLQWNCDELPHVNAQFSGIDITNCGEFHSKSLFENLVRVSFSGYDENKSYTLVMVDPDAPGSSAGQGWLHLIRSSISGADLAPNGNFVGTDVTPYTKPTPPNGTGRHRYFFYLYEELQTSPTAKISKRGRFDIQQFATDNNLCGPVAMNMFVTEF